MSVSTSLGEQRQVALPQVSNIKENPAVEMAGINTLPTTTNTMPEK